MDSGFRRNDIYVDPFVIPAKAGIQTVKHFKVFALFIEKIDWIFIHYFNLKNLVL